MKWKGGHSNHEFLPEKTFLIIKDNLESLTSKHSNRWIKSKSAVDTGTWPPKLKKHTRYSSEERPKTANLEKPNILDPSLVNKLDMSLLSKELLSDSMTRIQLGVKKLGGGMALNDRRGTQLTIIDKRSATVSGVENKTSYSRYKRRSFDHLTTVDHHSTNKETSLESIMSKQLSPSSRMSNDRVVKRRSLDVKKLDGNNNKNEISSTTLNSISKPVPLLSAVKVIKSSKPSISSEIEVFTNSKNKLVPEPCKTCGRPDQPERFHSHPKGVASSKIQNNNDIRNEIKDSERKTVQKPVPLNFRSEKKAAKDEKIDITMEKSNMSSAMSRPSSDKKGPRTVTCYICAREFGTASFPIHEPKCIQKWERENNALPTTQRRPVPKRPTVSLDDHNWNLAAWEQSQMQLVPCAKCGRTFLPYRLLVHEKTCKATSKLCFSSFTKSNKLKSGINRSNPSTVLCKICGRAFGIKSIQIHEPQCLKKWQMENEHSLTESTNQMTFTSFSPRQDSSLKRTTTCYICNRDFGSASIDIHEPQCLKKWHIENAKLPLNQRKREPEKVDVAYHARNDIIDWTTSEERWQSHLGQLIPCKHCKRTFNPERVLIHERNCKGPR